MFTTIGSAVATRIAFLLLCTAGATVVAASAAYLSKKEESTAVAAVKPPQSADLPAVQNPLASVNYHFLRQCNYSCKFCFHTDNKSKVLSLADAKKGLLMLYDAGTKKINFSGGEPFLQASMLGEMCRYAKKELGMSVSIISNASLIRRAWMEKYGDFVDILGISCDSAVPTTNQRIGRSTGNKDHVSQLRQVRQWCREFNIKFKMNTVVCAFNQDEDMNELLLDLEPARWKVFQCLAIDGENAGDNQTERDVSELLVTDEQFAAYLERHRAFNPVDENNSSMRNSYLILDENMCFLNNEDNRKVPTSSILHVGVMHALEQAGFNYEMFVRRGGIYDWSRDQISNSKNNAITDVPATQALRQCKARTGEEKPSLLDW